VAFVNQTGYLVDLSWDHVVEFCKNSGLYHVPEIWRGKKKDFDVNALMDKRYFDEGLTQCLPLSDENTVDEGIVIRVDTMRPYFMKAKSPLFYQHETALNDKGVTDIETQESIISSEELKK
jgi:hypothetical protein